MNERLCTARSCIARAMDLIAELYLDPARGPCVDRRVAGSALKSLSQALRDLSLNWDSYFIERTEPPCDVALDLHAKLDSDGMDKDFVVTVPGEYESIHGELQAA